MSDPVDALIQDRHNSSLNARLPARLRSIFNCRRPPYWEIEFADLQDIRAKIEPAKKMYSVSNKEKNEHMH